MNPYPKKPNKTRSRVDDRRNSHLTDPSLAPAVRPGPGSVWDTGTRRCHTLPVRL